METLWVSLFHLGLQSSCCFAGSTARSPTRYTAKRAQALTVHARHGHDALVSRVRGGSSGVSGLGTKMCRSECVIWLFVQGFYSRSRKVGNPTASILKSNEGVPALFVLNPASNFLGFTIGFRILGPKPSTLSMHFKPNCKIRDLYFISCLGAYGVEVRV